MPPLKNFERLIEERTASTLTLACGHTMPALAAAASLDYAVCEACVEAFRRKLDEVSSARRCSL